MDLELERSCNLPWTCFHDKYGDFRVLGQPTSNCVASGTTADDNEVEFLGKFIGHCLVQYEEDAR
jgi:hypothetical protein